MFPQFSDKDLMRDVYIAIESLRRSADLIDSHMYAWISGNVRVREDRGQEWVQHRRTLWHELGVDVETAELLAADLQLWWEGGRLSVLRGAFADRDLWDAIASALMAAWRFAKFTESRWLTVGSSARTLTVGLLTGLESLVRFIEKDELAGKWYLKGFRRLHADRKQFLVVAAIVGRVPEAFQYQLMKDSRVAKNTETMWGRLRKS